VFDYLLLDQYPNPQDLAAVRKGQAGAPIGQQLKASELPLVPSAGEQLLAPLETAPAN